MALELSYAKATEGSNPQPCILGQTDSALHKASSPQATKLVSLCRDLADMCISSQFILVSFSLISPWGLIDGDKRQSIAVWQNVYYQPSRKWLLRGNFELPDYDAVSHILNCSEQCIKVLQGDLVFHSVLGKKHSEANWFQGKASIEDSNSLYQPYGRNRELSNVHFISTDCSGGDPTANTPETPDPVIHTAKASGPCNSCLQELDRFLPASPAIITETGFLGGTSFFTISLSYEIFLKVRHVDW